jgi:hypothetical protein
MNAFDEEALCTATKLTGNGGACQVDLGSKINIDNKKEAYQNHSYKQEHSTAAPVGSQSRFYFCRSVFLVLV